MKLDNVAHHISARPSTGQKHVGRDLAQEIANEENADTGLVLRRAETEIFFEIVKSGKCDSIAIKIIEPVKPVSSRVRPLVAHEVELSSKVEGATPKRTVI